MVRALGASSRSGFEQRFLAQERAQQARGQTEAFFGQMQEQSREAEAASQAKYQEMLGVAGETTGQRQADIRQDYASRAADITQQQARLGMSGTTVGTSLRGGVEREKQSSLNRLADTMQQTRLGIMGQQAAVGERFAGQRQAMLGQQVGMQQAGNAAFMDAQSRIEAARLSAAPGLMTAQGQQAKMERFRKLTRPSTAG